MFQFILPELLDLAWKIGQLFSVPARGTTLTDDLVRHVRNNHVGGIIWFQSTREAARAITEELQRMSRTPLLVSADFESGVGMRFTDALWWPPAMALAATGDLSLAEEQARATAREALSLGVRQILAPVADVNVDPRNPVINTRSFGEDARRVGRWVAATVRGIQDEGALAAAKHFPGHGDTHIDSHRSLPILDVTRERLEEVELIPFRAAIDAGVGSIMIGHLSVPAIDHEIAPTRASFENVYGTHDHEVPRSATMPASLSRSLITDVLRGQLGFDGLVVSDAFDMGGLAAHFDPGEAAVRAIDAGIDQILYSADTDAAISAVQHAVRAGRIRESRIEESVERIRRAAPHPVFGHPLPASGERARRGADVAHEIARRSITLVRDAHGLLPLRARDVATLVVTDLPEENPLGDAMREMNLSYATFIEATTPDVDVSADVILMLLAVRPKSGAGRMAVPRAARRIAEHQGRRTIAISFGSPYVLEELGEVSTFICAWGVQPILQVAAVRALRGHAPMTGRLPVTI